MIDRMLAKQFEMNVRTMELNLDGVSHEQSLFRPQPAGNSVNWIVGHVLANRDAVHRLLGLDPAWGDGSERYVRGSEPITDPSDAVPLDSLLARLRVSQRAVAAALDAAGDTLLTAAPQAQAPQAQAPQAQAPQAQAPQAQAPGGEDSPPAGLQLAFLAFHESYHAGQLGLLRRLLGFAPAIT
jgi:hypothetical protein